jgi:P4 family phage/plasmid primase-like protien
MSENKYGILDEYKSFSDKLVKQKPITELIDLAALKNAWLLYGSKKAPEQESYRVSKIYDAEMKPLTLYEAFKDYVLYDEDEERIPLNDSNISLNLPRILSICPYGRKTYEIRANLVQTPALIQYVHKPKITKDREDNRDDDQVDTDVKTLKQIIHFLDPKRADDRNDWMSVGWAIFNITRGSDEGLDIWMEFSRLSPKFNEARCIYEWTNMEDRKKITLGTLKYFAKQDNPDKYYRHLSEENRQNMRVDLKTSHYELAMIMHQMFSDEFVYTEPGGWYQYTNHHWQSIESGYELRSKISKDLVNFFENIRREDENPQTESEDYQKLIKTYQRLHQSLKMTQFKNSIMRECQEIFYERGFEKKLDNNRYLIGFQNGVFDLEKNIFRPGLPTDYISQQMAINYTVFSETDSRVREVHNFLEKVFPDSSVRRYFLDVMSETFVGYNHRKHVYYWTGEGNNGKSITQEFFEKMFGRLSIKAPTTLITSKRPNSGSANAELARTGNGVRTMFLEEPDGDEEIYTGVFKQLSGNDSYYARDLFQKGKDSTEIVPMFKMFVICNKLPKIKKGGDTATWNRIRVIPFEATFVPGKEAPSSIEEQLKQKKFPKDPTFSDRIPHLVEPLAWVLLEHRTKPKMVDEPEKVSAATDKYRKGNDYVFQFLSQTTTEDEKGSVDPSDLFARYRDWLSDGFPGTKLMQVNEFTEDVIRKWGELNERGMWSGRRVIFEPNGGERSSHTTVDHLL